jgi:transposase-like protein
MALERENHCPACDGLRPFTRSASTHLHLGLKAKWVCQECEYQFVLVDDTIDTSA